MDLKILCLLLSFVISHCKSEINVNLVEHSLKLPSFVCRIINDVIRKDSVVNKIAIAVLNNKFRTKIEDEIIECLPKLKVTTMVINFEKSVMNSLTVDETAIAIESRNLNSNNADVVIMITDSLDQVKKN